MPDAAGFVVNKLLFPYLFDAVRLLERDGIDAQGIDTCMKLGAGHPMGPLALLDFVGLDVAVAIGESIGAEVPDRVRELIAEGKLGRKAGERASTATAGGAGAPGAQRSRAGAERCRRLHAGRQVPDDVGLADALGVRQLGDAVPRQRGLGQVVPAGQRQRLQHRGDRPARARTAP